MKRTLPLTALLLLGPLAGGGDIFGPLAAVTSVAVGAPRAPAELRFDRPFFLAIRDNATGTLLFVGQIVDPR